MRVSIDPHDRGYDQFIKLGGHSVMINVILDGEYQRDVVTADEELGLVEIPVRNNGSLVVDPIKGEFVHHVKYGKVEISVERRRD